LQLYANLDEIMKKSKIKDPATHTWNIDKTNLSSNPAQKIVFNEQGLKYPEKIN